MAFALAVEKNRHDYKRLFAFQRDMPVANPPANWRETLALTLITVTRLISITSVISTLKIRFFMFLSSKIYIADFLFFSLWHTL